MSIALLKQLVEMLWHFLWLIPLVALAAIIRPAWLKGKLGEFIVNRYAKSLLDEKRYHLIKNVTLPTEDGSTQIDHIIVSIFGVFVIETKNMKGWIFGDRNKEMWIQKFPNYHSHQFQNPLHQNYKHVKTLQSLLGLKDQQIHSLIVFVGDSKFKTELPENVTCGKGFIEYIKSKTEAVVTAAEAKEIIDKIEEGRLEPSFKTDREHVQYIRSKYGAPTPMVFRGPRRRIVLLFVASACLAVAFFILFRGNMPGGSKRNSKAPDTSAASSTSVAPSQPGQQSGRSIIESDKAESFFYKIALKSGREIAARKATRDGEWVKIVTTTGLYMEIPWQDINYILKTNK